MNAYLVGPDCGDCVAALAVVKHLGRGHIRLYETPGTKGWPQSAYDYIRPLIAAQDYCQSVERWREEEDLEFTHNFTPFRNNWGSGRTLVCKQAACVGVKPSDIDLNSPWLKVPEAPKHGKIIVVQTERHQGCLQYFRLVRAKAKDCVFIGTQDEFSQHCWNNGKANDPRPLISYQPTRDALDAAQWIMGARLYVGNPTMFTWISQALGHPNMLVDCSETDAEFIREGVRNVKTIADNPLPREWSTF